MRALQRLLNPIRQRIKFMLARGILKLSDSSDDMQSLQITLLNEEVLADVEHFEPYGFTANPQDGAEVLALSLAGNRSNTVVVCVADRQYRLTGLAKGEVALYTDEGDSIILRRNNNIEINAATQVTVNAPTMHCTGNITADGDITAAGDVTDATSSMQGMRDIYNGHTHSDPQGGSVSPTAQVM